MESLRYRTCIMSCDENELQHVAGGVMAPFPSMFNVGDNVVCKGNECWGTGTIISSNFEKGEWRHNVQFDHGGSDRFWERELRPA